MSRRAPSRQSPPQGVPAAAWARLTAFQRRVYAAILRIPPGQTRSYQWVAAHIGSPRGARAVGNALHRNPCLRRDAICTLCGVPHRRRRGRQAFAPKVPCHRVVRADGSLGGYSGGLSKKRALLRAEGRLSPRNAA